MMRSLSLLLLLLLSPSLWAGSVVLDREQLASWLQNTETQRAILASEGQWLTLTPETLGATGDPKQVLAQEWVVHKQLLRMFSLNALLSEELTWVTRWQSYLSRIIGGNHQPLFDISSSASALAEQWQLKQAKQSVLAQLHAGTSLFTITTTPQGAALVQTSWPQLSPEVKQAFRSHVAQQPLSAHQILLVIMLLEEHMDTQLAKHVIDQLDASQLNLHSQRLQSALGQHYASLLRYAARRPELANTALPLLATHHFSEPETQDLLFQHLGLAQSGVTSAAILANYGDTPQWDNLVSLLKNQQTQPSLIQHNALLALHLSRAPEAETALQRVPWQLQQQLLTEPVYNAY